MPTGLWSSVRRSIKRRDRPFRRLFFDHVDHVHEFVQDEQTEKLLKACQESDVNTVKELLVDKSCPNYCCHDIMDRTPLQIAVENEDTEIIGLLLPKYRTNEKCVMTVMEALLDSLQDENESVALAIVNHWVFKEMESSKKSEAPILIAAQKEMYEVVNLFKNRSYAIGDPHPLNCSCVNCYHCLNEDPFKFAHRRLNVYRGLASVSYLSLFETDPILRAMKLRQEIIDIGKEERYFKAEYEVLGDQLSTFLFNLLDKVCDTDELDAILHKSEQPNEDKWESLARVKLALKYGEKMFIAHPSCQLQITNAFFKGFRSSQKASFPKRILLVLLFLISYPALAFIHIFAPNVEKLGSKIIKAPVSKFISHSFFYLLMLLCVVASTVNVIAATEQKFQVPQGFNTSGFFKLVNDTTDVYYVRSANMNITQILILVWIVGLVWQEIKQIYLFGFFEHFSSLLNWLDLVMVFVYLISYALRIFTYFRVKSAVSYFTSDPNTFFLLNENDTTATDHQYWINADRFYWKQTDFLILAELIFSVANVMSFARILGILPFSKVLGPLQISFTLMLKDIMRFLGLFLLVFVAFAVGMSNIYWYYDEFTRTSVALAEHGKSTAELHYSGVVDSFKSCFWSIFGMLDPGSPDLNGYTLQDSHIVQITGFIVYGAFMVVTIIILFNLLIAMMTSTYERFSADVTVEWKFARAELIFEYMQPGFTLPVPLNLIPTWKSVFYILRWIFCCRWVDKDSGTVLCCRCVDTVAPEKTEQEKTEQQHPTVSKTKKWAESSRPKEKKPMPMIKNALCGLCRGSVIVNPVVKLNYTEVIGRVVRRFIKDGYMRKADIQADLENLRQDIFRLRHQVNKVQEKQNHK